MGIISVARSIYENKIIPQGKSLLSSLLCLILIFLHKWRLQPKYETNPRSKHEVWMNESKHVSGSLCRLSLKVEGINRRQWHNVGARHRPAYVKDDVLYLQNKQDYLRFLKFNNQDSSIQSQCQL